MNDKNDWILNEMTREARNKLKVLWILEAPEKELRRYLSDLINHIYEIKVVRRKGTKKV